MIVTYYIHISTSDGRIVVLRFVPSSSNLYVVTYDFVIRDSTQIETAVVSSLIEELAFSDSYKF